MKPFKILFVYPNFQMIPLLPSNISILSACLKENGFEVDLFDTTLYKIEEKSIDEKRVELLQLRPFDFTEYGIKYKDSDVYSDFKKKIETYKPDLIAVTLVEDTVSLALSLLQEVKELSIPVIAGGVHVTFSPESIINHEEIDMICCGEGEDALPELCKKMQSGEPIDKIKNIWSKKGTKIIKNPMRKLLELDDIPYNDFSIFEKERFYRPMQGKIFRMIPIEIDRGCPYRCTYCGSPALREIYKQETDCNYYRKKSFKRIFEEMGSQIEKYNAEYLYFNSETFLAMSDSKFSEFAAEYISKINLPFWCQTRIETIKDNKIKLLEKMGCNRLSVGIEQGNEEFRAKVLGKTFTNNQVIQAFDILKKYSIPITVNNMIGFPDETRELVFDTIYLNRKLNIDSTNVFIFTPYLGTKLREVAIEKGYLKPDAHTNSLIENTLCMPLLSEKEIMGLLRTFPLYLKMDESRFPEIKIAEADTPEGNSMFKLLSDEYKDKFWTAA